MRQAPSFQYKRSYTGPVKAVICDWAGTIVDFGSVAPIRAFQALFESHGVMATEAEAREPMGAEKSEHIRRMLAMPSIQKQWLAGKGRASTEDDVQALYHEFLPIQIEAIRANSRLIPGWLDSVDIIRAQGIKIGGNTGYSTEMYQALAEVAKEYGYETQANVCATEVSKGRPYPYMAQAVMEKLEIAETQACIKVDDTEIGIEEGLNAGMWTVAVALSGNANGLTHEEWEALNGSEQAAVRLKSYKRMATSGAHFVIDSVADLPDVIDQINLKLANGIQP